ncbi:hypothetical protein [Winogradskyella schleiferi]|uniref:hypothetical protein n=1 Tax=Winogradskyella schleiferi TaxID=2686078 RepID=UPI0015BAF4E8|nr:hypothetical protein [Winogradskyella schleiferi]
MKQKQSIYNPILWVLFGFALISAVHAIIETLIYGYFHYGLSDGFIDIHFRYYIPAFSLVTTFIFSIITMLILKKKITTLKIETSKLPWLTFVSLIIIASIAKPLVQIWSDNKVMSLYDDLSKTEYLSRLNLVNIFNTIEYSSIGSLWLLFLLLVVYFLYLNRRSKI